MGREGLNLFSFINQFLHVKLLGTDDSLGCVVDYNVKSRKFFLDSLYKRRNLLWRCEIALDQIQPLRPFLVIWLFLVTQKGIFPKPSRRDNCRAVSEQLDCNLETNFNPGTSHQSYHTWKVCSLVSFLKIEVTTVQTETIIKVMDFCIASLANVAFSHINLNLRRL